MIYIVGAGAMAREALDIYRDLGRKTTDEYNPRTGDCK